MMNPNFLRRSLGLAVAATLLALGSGSVAWSATPRAASGCTVRIARYSFSPDSATEGERIVLRLRIRNCTDTEQDVTVTQYGLQPPGCAVLDPVSRPAAIAAGGVYRSRSRMIAPTCTGVETMTVNITGATGTPLATATAKLTVT
jgi:hypothetical protein